MNATISKSGNPHPFVGDSAHSHDPFFETLLAESRATASSPDFTHVLKACLNQATNMMLSNVEESLFRQDFSSGEETRVKLAAILPSFSSWSQAALNTLPNELVDVSVQSP